MKYFHTTFSKISTFLYNTFKDQRQQIDDDDELKRNNL